MHEAFGHLGLGKKESNASCYLSAIALGDDLKHTGMHGSLGGHAAGTGLHGCLNARTHCARLCCRAWGGGGFRARAEPP